VRLESLNGHFVELAVSGYQFGSGQSTSAGVDWDANWLMIRGKAWDGTQSWEFDDPCMTTWEARELSSWLRGLGNANPATVAAAEPQELRLWLTEPNLMFALHATSEGVTTLDVYFDAESRPPTGSNDDDAGLGHRVRLATRRSTSPRPWTAGNSTARSFRRGEVATSSRTWRGLSRTTGATKTHPARPRYQRGRMSQRRKSITQCPRTRWAFGAASHRRSQR